MRYFTSPINSLDGRIFRELNKEGQLKYLPFLFIKSSVWWSIIIIAFVFEVGLNLALLFWNYWRLIFYPFWWFLIFPLESELQWWLGLLLSLLVDYLIGFPLGFSWLVVSFLDFSCYFLLGSWWHLNRVQQAIRLILLAGFLSVVVSFFFFLPPFSLLGFFIETVFLMNYGLRRNAKFYR